MIVFNILMGLRKLEKKELQRHLPFISILVFLHHILISLFFDPEFPTNPWLLEYNGISHLANLSLYLLLLRLECSCELWCVWINLILYWCRRDRGQVKWEINKGDGNKKWYKSFLVWKKYFVMQSNAQLVRWQFQKRKVATKWSVRTVASISAIYVTRPLMDMIISGIYDTRHDKL